MRFGVLGGGFGLWGYECLLDFYVFIGCGLFECFCVGVVLSRGVDWFGGDFVGCFVFVVDGELFWGGCVFVVVYIVVVVCV